MKHDAISLFTHLSHWVEQHREDAWMDDLSEQYGVIDLEYLHGEIQRLLQNAR